jgi:hypothetical protein
LPRADVFWEISSYYLVLIYISGKLVEHIRTVELG